MISNKHKIIFYLILASSCKGSTNNSGESDAMTPINGERSLLINQHGDPYGDEQLRQLQVGDSQVDFVINVSNWPFEDGVLQVEPLMLENNSTHRIVKKIFSDLLEEDLEVVSMAYEINFSLLSSSSNLLPVDFSDAGITIDIVLANLSKLDSARSYVLALLMPDDDGALKEISAKNSLQKVSFNQENDQFKIEDLAIGRQKAYLQVLSAPAKAVVFSESSAILRGQSAEMQNTQIQNDLSILETGFIFSSPGMMLHNSSTPYDANSKVAPYSVLGNSEESPTIKSQQGLSLSSSYYQSRNAVPGYLQGLRLLQ
ncbi:MAG: hypothetical protein KBD78_00035 [Oligoflexales bacterium]|nr:hypothetical protein [Oligoflexales bacterium]